MFPLFAQYQFGYICDLSHVYFLFFGKGRLRLELGMVGVKIKFVVCEMFVIYVLLLHMYSL